jgi:hypothetical protein
MLLTASTRRHQGNCFLELTGSRQSAGNNPEQKQVAECLHETALDRDRCRQSLGNRHEQRQVADSKLKNSPEQRHVADSQLKTDMNRDR